MPEKFKVILITIIFLFLPVFVLADSLGQAIEFFVNPDYDLSQKEEISATLRKVGRNAYFYLDDDWWESLDFSEKQKAKNALNSLNYEFSSKIYPILASTFGSEWKPGIDKDERITVLIHPMKEEAGGYFNNGDEYLKLQNPKSNEREMVYLNANHITNPLAKSFLAHEFVHLITFNQKEKLRGVSGETWLNEARAEYTPTLLGYDDEYEGSNLQRRVKKFLSEPYDSITEWQNKSSDYGALNIFTQYLVQHYGIEILRDSLQSEKVGILSLNYALKKNNLDIDFSQIFTNWTIAILINDCNLDEVYCYLSENFKKIRVVPFINYLPFVGESTLSVTDTTKVWSGNWHKFIGGKEVLKLEFSGSSATTFKIPYVIEDSEGNFSVSFLELDENQKGTIYTPDFSSKNLSLTIIPSVQTKISNFSDSEPFYLFSWLVTTVERTPIQEEELIQELLKQIEELKKEITRIQAKINEILGKPTCQKFENDLYYGMRNDWRVRCLQQFLKSQDPEIYPEGLITGNFLSLTEAAVIRFQEKYADEILKPLSLEKGTGYFGPKTRAKASELSGF